MPRAQAIHLRGVNYTVCSRQIHAVKWTTDPRDVTCNNCLRTVAYAAAPGVKPK